MKIKKILMILMILSTFSMSLDSYELDLPIRVNRISERAAVFRLGDGHLGSNVSVIASDKGLIVIDTHLSNTIAEKFKKEVVKEFGRDDFVYVINTHHHFDHSGGNQVFKEAWIIGHSNAIPAMRRFEEELEEFYEKRVAFVKGWGKRAEKLGIDTEEGNAWKEAVEYNQVFLEDIKKGYKVTPPQITFNDSLSLHAGDLTVKMVYLGQAHTESDIFVYIPEERIIFIGDTFYSGTLTLPVYSGNFDVARWIAAFEKVFNDIAEIKTVVCGHSLMSEDELRMIFKYFKTLWSLVTAEVKKGSGHDMIVKTLSLEKQFNWISGMDITSDRINKEHNNNIRFFLKKLK
jgi:glyoxylase-like metal-dependent hydrolase (beta-lactamase superfamily II)